ncbi:transposase domain-containing protein [Protofrankia symbiont of Coriaria ruscifolia]|uniref:transposase domain-containing protein n=1 Tax=Protofrankia symbiont of Coriaria ruscifolia TaxID=1306542 RepID=UPI002415847B|nr:transposase domain-containing protein [Protofrankia symbiont of Coriaria ruscifolia]
MVDRVLEATDTVEVRRRLLPSRLVVYFVLSLWLFRGRNCGYGQVISKLVDAFYHRLPPAPCRRPAGGAAAGPCRDGGRRFRP